MINSSGAVITQPNGGNLFLRSQPLALASYSTVINPTIWMGFDCSGAADTATAIIKLNHLAIRKAYS